MSFHFCNYRIRIAHQTTFDLFPFYGFFKTTNAATMLIMVLSRAPVHIKIYLPTILVSTHGSRALVSFNINIFDKKILNPTQSTKRRAFYRHCAVRISVWICVYYSNSIVSTCRYRNFGHIQYASFCRILPEFA